MWKKLIAVLLGLVGTASIVVAMNHSMTATDSGGGFAIGGDVYGQMGPPSIGDRIYLGTKNNFNQPMGWEIMIDYGSSYFSGATSFMDESTGMIDIADVEAVRFYSYASTIYEKSAVWKSFDEFNDRMSKNTQDMKLVMPKDVRWLNSVMTEPQIIAFRENEIYGIHALQAYNKHITASVLSGTDLYRASVVQNIEVFVATERYATSGDWGTAIKGEAKAYPFIDVTNGITPEVMCGTAPNVNPNKTICPWTASTKPTFNMTPNPYDLQVYAMTIDSVPQVYHFPELTSNWSSDSMIPSGRGFYSVITKGDTITYMNDNPFGTLSEPSIGKPLPIRAYIELNKEFINKTVFSLSQTNASGNGYVEIKAPITRSIGSYVTGEDRKLRISEDSMIATFLDIIDEKDESIYTKQKIAKTEVAKVSDSAIIKLEVNGNAGTHNANGINFGTNTISALIFDDTGAFIAYAPLHTTVSGNGYYEMDMKKYKDLLEVGKTYSIQVVNEVYSADPTQVSPANCSDLSAAFRIELFESLEMTYTPTFDETKTIDASNTAYQYRTNVSGGSKIGDLNLWKGATPVTLEIVQDEKHQADGHDDDWMNFTFYQDGVTNETESKIKVETNRDTKSNVDVKLKASAPDLASDGYLKPGVYYFTITGVDNAGLPDPKLSVDVQLAVFPHDSQITYTQQKNKGNNTYYTKKQLNALAANASLGTVELDGPDQPVSANIAGLYKEGYVLKGVTFVNVGTDTENAYLKTDMTSVDMSDPLTINIWKKGGADFTKYADTIMKFDVVLTFTHNSKEIATVRLKEQEFILVDDLIYYDAEGNKLEYTKENPVQVTYDPTVDSTDNEKLYYASDSATANAMVKYCILNASNECTASSAATAVSLSPDQALTQAGLANAGKVFVTSNGPGTTSKDVTIRAILVNEEGTTLTYTDLYYRVNPAAQELEWKGTDIQDEGNNITKLTDAQSGSSHPTWKLALKYDSITASNNVYTISELYKDGAPDSGNIGLVSNVIGSDGAPELHINYELKLSVADQGAMTFDQAAKTITIHKELTNEAQLIATAQGTDNYAATVNADDPSTPTINEDGSATLSINVSSKPDLKFTPADGFTDYQAYATSKMANGEEAFGTMSLDPDKETITGYHILKVQMLDVAATKEQGKEVWKKLEGATSFKMGGTAMIKDQLYSYGTLISGKYKVTAVAKNGNVEVSKQKEITITIEDEGFALGKLKWQKKLKDDTAFQDVTGTINAVTKINSKAIETTYEENGILYVSLTETEKDYLKDATIIYEVKDTESGEIITVDSSGKITMKKAGSAYVKAHITKNGFANLDVYVPINIGKGSSEFMFTDSVGDPLSQEGKELTKDDKGVYEAYTDTYEKDKVLDIFTTGAPEGAEVTIQINSNVTPSPTLPSYNDVLKFKGDDHVTKNEDTDIKTCVISKDEYTGIHLTACQTMIENALMNANDSITITATTSATEGYESQTITLPVKINKADQTFKFKESELHVIPSNDGRVNPTFENKESTGKIQMSLIPKNGEADYPTDTKILKGTDEMFVNQKDTVWYNLPITDEEASKQFHVYAICLGDRNYKQSDQVSMLIIVDPEAGSFYDITQISFKPDDVMEYEDIYYGDEYFILEAYSGKDDTETGFYYTYELFENAGSYVQKVEGMSDTFKPIKAGAKVKFKVTRTNREGVSESPMIYTTEVKKLSVKMIVQDIDKLQGEKLTTEEYQFTEDSGTFLEKDKEMIGSVSFSCKRGTKELITLPFVESKDHGSAITAQYKETSANKEVLSNYNLSIKNGVLNVTAEESAETWFEVIPGEQNDGTATDYNEGWYNGPADVALIASESGLYDEIGQAMEGPFDTEKFTVDKEGSNDVNVYFHQSSGDHEGAVSLPQKTNVKIDQTPPTLKHIKAAASNNQLEDLLNMISGGLLFQPGTTFTLETSDAKGELEVSGTKEVKYSLYRLETDGTKTELKKDEVLPIRNETGSFKLEGKSGTYEICTIAKDHAGNEEDDASCTEVRMGYDNVNIITGGGTCPDLNLDLNDDGILELNIDLDGDKIPDMNIDTDYDGTADINIDTDKDNRPDLNLVILSDWNPRVCTEVNGFVYATQTGIEPVINVDTNEDGVPELDIDNNGDFKADINISRNGRAWLNVAVFHEWKPIHDYTYDGFEYDSIGTGQPEYKRKYNIDTDGDGKPDVNINLEGTHKPTVNIDLDGDEIPDISIDSTGDGIPDLNLDIDGNGTPDENVYIIDHWKPEQDVTKGADVYDTMIIERKPELEQGGIVVKPEGGNSGYLPNFQMKVTTITDTIDEGTKTEILAGGGIPNGSVKQVIDVWMEKDGVTIQPSGTVELRIPVDKELANPTMVKRRADGSWEKVEYVIKDGYYVIKMDELGEIAWISEEPETPKDPAKPGTSTNPPTSVKGAYYPGTGGANTGDDTDYDGMIALAILSIGILTLSYRKHHMQS